MFTEIIITIFVIVLLAELIMVNSIWGLLFAGLVIWLLIWSFKNSIY